MFRVFCGIVLAVAALVPAGCEMGTAPANLKKSPRPVTVIELKRTTPRPTSQLTGSVVAWKTEEMGFQVAGRVESVLEPGKNIRGRTVDENNRPLAEGTIIARMEKDRYELKLAAAQAQRATAAARVKAKDSELKSVIPQQIVAAQASVTLATEEFERTKTLFERGASTKSDFERAKARLDTSKAELEQTNASKTVTAAELLSLDAQEKEAAENVSQAEKDLADTLLRSPFNGQVAEVHQIAGGYVQAGAAVVTVQMMDPIAVEIAVSAETDSQINYSDVVSVYLPDSEQPLEALVYEKATIADPATRTFNLTLLVRNERVEVGLPADERHTKTPRVRSLWRLFAETRERIPPFYINVDSLFQDADGYFVWRAANATQADRYGPKDAKIELEKVRVKPGEKRMPFLQVATMRELTDIGDLKPETDLVAGAFFRRNGSRIPAEEVVRTVKDGETVPYVRERWLLRPGDIVRADLAVETPTAGFYVPNNVILEEEDKTYVFVVETSGEATRVKRVEVIAADALGTQRRIEAAGKDKLTAGTKIVDNGALFLADGEAISVVEGSGEGR